MWEVLEVLRRVNRGEGQRFIQRVTVTGHSRIRRWTDCAKELGWAWGSRCPMKRGASEILLQSAKGG